MSSWESAPGASLPWPWLRPNYREDLPSREENEAASQELPREWERRKHPLEIRKLTSADTKLLLDFYRSLSPVVVDMFEPFTTLNEEVIRKMIEETDAGQHVGFGLIAEDGRIVGHSFVWDIREEKPFFGVGLTECVQGQGLGRKIMQVVLDEGDALGVPLVTLTVLKRNTRAKNLYDTMGFELKSDFTFREENDSYYMERTRPGQGD